MQLGIFQYALYQVQPACPFGTKQCEYNENSEQQEVGDDVVMKQNISYNWPGGKCSFIMLFFKMDILFPLLSSGYL